MAELALAVRGLAAPDLLETYQAERRPAGKAIVDRAIQIAFTDEMDMEDEKEQFLLEMQMTMNYAGSPLVGERSDDSQEFTSGPLPGYRAPDVSGLVRFGVGHPSRLFDVTRGTKFTLLLYADGSVDEETVTGWEKLADAAVSKVGGQVETCVIASPDAVLPAVLELPVYRDSGGLFQRTYDVGGLLRTSSARTDTSAFAPCPLRWPPCKSTWRVSSRADSDRGPRPASPASP